MGPLLAEEKSKNAWEKGEADIPLWGGAVSIGTIKGILCCSELLDGMVRDAENCLSEVTQ